MLFSSIQFVIFFLLVFSLYWFVTNKNIKAQNILLLVANYIFYGWWDWRFLFLLGLLSLANYYIGIKIDEQAKKRKLWLIIGLIVNLGVLGVFKYYNFFIDSFIYLVSLIGYQLPKSTTKILLPLGISFYVFLSISYIIDIYKKILNPNRNIVQVLLALSFFPIILAGPIQRPSSLLPQIIKRREFNYSQATDGLKQILWGLFAKVVIADNLSSSVDDIFINFHEYSGSMLVLGALFFSIQIYADFSGYSNMSIGIAKLLGFNLMQNFAFPYFSRNISEYWKKYHISLTTWFRDYVFFPIFLSASWKIKNGRVFFLRTEIFIYIAASSITWFLTGLWHGANFTFIVWGMINGLILIVYHLQENPRKKLLKRIGVRKNNPIVTVFETLLTLLIIIVAWVFFRADSCKEAILYLDKMSSESLFVFPEIFNKRLQFLVLDFLVYFSIIIFFIIEWYGRKNEFAISYFGSKRSKTLRWVFYFIMLFAVIALAGNQQKFIYFQF